MDSLTEQERAILDLERRWWATPGGKEEAIRTLGWSPVRYYRRLNQLIESEAALMYDAVVVNRLRRIARRGGR
ncbi:helix-turn-helix DNA binding protein [Mycobacterium phage Tortellini]|uniref:Helix-turn-helix DNA binding protein n=2 Tax=Pclasvirinae TaxID=1982878 RepID=A0A1D8EX33_9CAUD|nr:DUF3263 domain-containing protein [Mycobacterium phage Tortellini]YP_009965242.1 DUF3263 domain-containing protein [Mycobacterium phage Xavia]AOT25778.1 helix-turn-helix DNA binding protein [Mycobacterium phage Tortellini]AWN02637.1 helix-turn-helix DNA binding protein [Mycobacterium phage Xavia]